MAILEQPSQAAALALSLFTSSLIFIRSTLVLNKYICPPKRFHILAYVFALMSGLMFWVTVNAVNEPIEIQLLSGFTASTLTWVVYVLLVNEKLTYPSKQQLVSWLFHIITEASILLQVRLILN